MGLSRGICRHIIRSVNKIIGSKKNMELGERITVIENFFYLTSHRNTGAAWGILSAK